MQVKRKKIDRIPYAKTQECTIHKVELNTKTYRVCRNKPSYIYIYIYISLLDIYIYIYIYIVSKFVLQSRYYFHFRANTLGKVMNPLILPAMG